MKSQNDLIVSVVAIVLALITAAALIFTKDDPQPVQTPEKVIETPLALPTSDIKFAEALPEADNQQQNQNNTTLGAPSAAGVGGPQPTAAGVSGGGGGGGSNMAAQ